MNKILIFFFRDLIIRLQIRKVKMFDEFLSFGDKIGVDYALFISDAYTGGNVTIADIRNPTTHISVNYYSKKK